MIIRPGFRDMSRMPVMCPADLRERADFFLILTRSEGKEIVNLYLGNVDSNIVL